MKAQIQNNQIQVLADYNENAIAAFRQLGGKWNKPYWIFDARTQPEVDTFLIDFYGHNGRDEYEKATIIIEVPSRTGEVSCCGFQIAHRRFRDSSAIIGNGCVVISGSFPRSGGSAKNPSLSNDEDVKIKILDFPVALFSKLKYKYSIVGELEEQKKRNVDLVSFSTDDLIAELESRGFSVKQNVFEKYEIGSIDPSLIDA